ncbi:MAG: polysaccharide deacetylase family protein [Firmicutes bacterium]|nr:polysaccharide deacetylase family protein [Bacillota bacterium]
MFTVIVNLRSRWVKIAIGIVIVGLLICLPFLCGVHRKLAPVFQPEDNILPIYYVETPEKKIAISFDASWGAERTPKILKILKEYDLKSTFFLTGIWIEAYPDRVKQIAEDGHEIGNHTATHPHMNQLTGEQIKEEMKKVDEMIHKLTGKRPTRLFRPPFGEYNSNVIKTVSSLGYVPVQWSIDSLDWRNLNKEAIIERVTSNPHNGAIVLFHNDGLHTTAALPEIIEFYTDNGYRIVPISELIYWKDYEIDPVNGAQRRIKK